MTDAIPFDERGPSDWLINLPNGLPPGVVRFYPHHPAMESWIDDYRKRDASKAWRFCDVPIDEMPRDELLATLWALCGKLGDVPWRASVQIRG